MLCVHCGASPSAHILDVQLDEKRMEAFSDAVIALGNNYGMTQEEMASACLAVAVNHMVATGIPDTRAGRSAAAMHRWRTERGLHEDILVTERAKAAASDVPEFDAAAIADGIPTRAGESLIGEVSEARAEVDKRALAKKLCRAARGWVSTAGTCDFDEECVSCTRILEVL